ncbi:PREDICTED: putative uncharacterized protein FLJ44672 [Colobus angolensis palliatus]|uniref:putative uncharacterized protein FLJ44672 n=1 Tax=Colobus angolensis palliatus TaxID=336983 RepID=UPI0005F529CB|nr:PREDICTED: putative uncharacterized protein FLJ44672 [Colobus angolensis palliatus]
MASPGPRLSQTSPTRPSSCLLLAPGGTAFDSSQWTHQPQLSVATSGQATAFWQPPRAQLLPVGPAPASRWPLKAQLIPHNSLFRPNFSPVAASPGPSSKTASFDSAPVQLLVALVGPKLPCSGLPRPRSCLTAAFPGHVPAGLPATSTSPAQVGLPRPTGCLSASSPGPTLPRRPSLCLQTASFDSVPVQLLAAFAQLLPIPMASPGTRLSQVSPSRPSSCLPPMACAGPKRPEVGLARPSSCLS